MNRSDPLWAGTSLLGTDGHAVFIESGGREVKWQPWRSDGTQLGTMQLGAFAGNPHVDGRGTTCASVVCPSILRAGDLMLFAACGEPGDRELWAKRASE